MPRRLLIMTDQTRRTNVCTIGRICSRQGETGLAQHAAQLDQGQSYQGGGVIRGNRPEQHDSHRLGFEATGAVERFFRRDITPDFLLTQLPEMNLRPVEGSPAEAGSSTRQPSRPSGIAPPGHRIRAVAALLFRRCRVCRLARFLKTAI